MNIRIEVKQSHIDAGQPGEMCGCPISLAIKEYFPGREVWVGMRAYIWQQKHFPAACVDGVGDFAISKRTAAAAIAFDKGEKIEPFRFFLRPVPNA